MMLVSCVNCCHNPLQSDSVGVRSGYCTEHRRLLLVPSQLTCGRLFRKDLEVARATSERDRHVNRFSPGMISLLSDHRKPANGSHTSTQTADLETMAKDTVAEAVLDYGKLDSKFASLAELKPQPGVRAELALLSLGRGYVNRCVTRGGPWTSGLHLVWWIRRRLIDEPKLEFEDLRVESPLPLARQVDLAKWSIVMMRLLLLSDVGRYAEGGRDPVRKLASLAEDAASNMGSLSSKQLLQWIKHKGAARFDSVLTEKRYRKLAETVREGASGA